MGYLVRKADAFWREWKKNPDRKPLIIKGARQVGKTETIRTFARENYKNVIEINFITEPSYKVIVEEGFSAEHIIKLISRIDPTKHFEENELVDYENDIVKYAQGLDKAKILSVYRSIPAQLAKENKKFQYSKVSKGGRSKDYMGCVEWLKDAGLINVCECLQFPELPLKGNVDESKYKVYISDTGLLVASLDDESQIDLRANKNLGIYKGALYENFVAEALVKQGYGLYYYSKDNSTLEEDFFIRSANELIPVEVKANTNRAKSMRQLIKSNTYTDIKHGIKLMAGNVGISENIVTFPYFCTFLLKRYMGKQNLFQ